MHLLAPIVAAEETASHSPQSWQVCGRWEAGDQGLRQRSQRSSHLWQRGSQSSSRRTRTRRLSSLPSVFCRNSYHVSSGSIPWTWKAAMRSSHAERGFPPRGGRHIRVAPGEVGHQSVPLAHVRDVSVKQGQGGAVRERLPPYHQPVAAVQLPAQRGSEVGGEHEEQRPWNVAQSGQGVMVRRTSSLKMRPGEPMAPPSGGSHRMVAASHPHVCISIAWSILLAWSTRRAGGGGAPG